MATPVLRAREKVHPSPSMKASSRAMRSPSSSANNAWMVGGESQVISRQANMYSASTSVASRRQSNASSISSNGRTSKHKKKQRRLSEKGKQKVIKHRARKEFERQRAAAGGSSGRGSSGRSSNYHSQSSGAEPSPRPVVSSRRPNARSYQVGTLEELEEDMARELEQEERTRLAAKLQHQHNIMANAAAKKKIGEYDRHQLEEQLLGRAFGEDKDDYDDLALEEPVEVIAESLERVLQGKQACVQYLSEPSSQESLASEPQTKLLASLDAFFRDASEPLHIRVIAMWRFCTVLGDWRKGENRLLNLRLAVFGYHLLLEVCEADEHPLEYAALTNSLEQVQCDLDRHQGTVLFTQVNNCHEDWIDTNERAPVVVEIPKQFL